jgi:hypothetical protein
MSVANGKLSEDEIELINREVKRLHLSSEDVEVLIDQARHDREAADDLAKLPLHVITARPAHSVEHFKTLVSEIRKLGLLTYARQFELAARGAVRLTDSERRLWQQLANQSTPEGGPSSPTLDVGVDSPPPAGPAGSR